MSASLKQPSPTPVPTATEVISTMNLPQGWIPYPNPDSGDKVWILFDMAQAGAFPCPGL